MKNKGTVPFQDQGRDAGAEAKASTQAREDEGGSVLLANSVHSWVVKERLTGFPLISVVQSRSQSQKDSGWMACYLVQLSGGARLDTA